MALAFGATEGGSAGASADAEECDAALLFAVAADAGAAGGCNVVVWPA